MIRFDREACRDLSSASQREWLETNGLGGYASSTITGLNTRRYHGLLVAATKPPVGRMVLLSKLEETLMIDGRSYELSTNQYAGVAHPRGFEHLQDFRIDPFPIFTYSFDGVEIEKSLFMIYGENSTVIQYSVRKTNPETGREIHLEVRPLIAFRDYHSTTHENEALNLVLEIETGLATLTPYRGLPALHLAHNADELESTGYWYRGFEYAEERERGLDFKEDLFSPCVFRFDLRGTLQPAIIASTERRDVKQCAALQKAELKRRKTVLKPVGGGDDLVQSLGAAADQFIVARGSEKSVIAGYHWFSDWGRDTMIALHGLTLTTRRFDVAKSILLAFAPFVDRGMLPNRFPDEAEGPEYNTVDATLWYFEAVRALLECTGIYLWVKEHLYDVLKDIIDWHERGTRYGIKVDEDGLLTSGEAGVQLTWMDAKVGDWVVTPRTGKPVEIQALWYNALRVMEELASNYGDQKGQKRYRKMALKAKESFNQLFWNEAAGCLYDVVDGEKRDGSIRPNQIFAVSLKHSMLSGEWAEQVVALVKRDLLTPYGLRSLAPGDPQYRGMYQGDPLSRDGAYHQGTVWAWLMGPFITAFLRVERYASRAQAEASEWLKEFGDHLSEAGLGQVSEIFDGDAPHTPRGCIAQAWSVAELLRVAVEDLEMKGE